MHTQIPSGTFTLSLQGITSTGISPKATVDTLRNAIMALDSRYNVSTLKLVIVTTSLIELDAGGCCC